MYLVLDKKTPPDTKKKKQLSNKLLMTSATRQDSWPKR